MQINGYSAKLRLQLKHIIWVHIHVMFEEDLLKTPAIVSKTNFEEKVTLNQEY